MDERVIYVQPAPGNGYGVAGFVFSILGLLTCGILCIPGLLLSLCGMMDRDKPQGLAIAGLIISGLGVAGYACLFVFWVFAMGSMATAIDQANQKAKAKQIMEQRQLDKDTAR